MRKFLLAAALLGAVAACGEKNDEGMEDSSAMAPPAAAPMTQDSSAMGGMAADSMSHDSTTAKPDSGSGAM